MYSHPFWKKDRPRRIHFYRKCNKKKQPGQQCKSAHRQHHSQQSLYYTTIHLLVSPPFISVCPASSFLKSFRFCFDISFLFISNICFRNLPSKDFYHAVLFLENSCHFRKIQGTTVCIFPVFSKNEEKEKRFPVQCTGNPLRNFS